MSRKSAASVSIAVAAVILFASAAYACVDFKGDLTVTSSSGTSGNLVTGNEGSMTYCTGRNPVTAGAAGKLNSLRVQVAAATACTSSSNHLNSGNNSVYLNNAKTDSAVPFKYDGSKWVFQGGTGCFLNPPGNILLTSSYSVSSGPGYTGDQTFLLTGYTLNRIDPTNMASALCVGGGGIGIFAPVRITSI